METIEVQEMESPAQQQQPQEIKELSDQSRSFDFASWSSTEVDPTVDGPDGFR